MSRRSRKRKRERVEKIEKAPAAQEVPVEVELPEPLDLDGEIFRMLLKREPRCWGVVTATHNLDSYNHHTSPWFEVVRIKDAKAAVEARDWHCGPYGAVFYPAVNRGQAEEIQQALRIASPYRTVTRSDWFGGHTTSRSQHFHGSSSVIELPDDYHHLF